MRDQPAAVQKKTRNRQRFKHLDAWIARTMAYCQDHGVVIGSEREAYDWFKRVQEAENGYVTPAQEMASISAEKVKDEYGFHLFQMRWRQATIPLGRRGGKIISLRRFLPLGPLGWRDTKATIAGAQSEQDYLLVAEGLTAAAKQVKQWAEGCGSLLTQAEVLTQMAAQPQLLFLAEPEDTEGDADDDDAE